MSTLTMVEILRKGRAVLERNGLNKGYFYDRDQAEAVAPADCRVCGVGALRVAMWGTPAPDFEATPPEWWLYDSAGDLLGRAAGVDHYPIWNDKPERTAAEVLAVFDKAIALAENTNITTGGTK